jgi:hypothetical protein
MGADLLIVTDSFERSGAPALDQEFALGKCLMP